METYTVKHLASSRSYSIIRESDKLPIAVIKKPRWVTNEEFMDLVSRLVINVREK
jgi:hypothetical protein